MISLNAARREEDVVLRVRVNAGSGRDDSGGEDILLICWGV